MTRISYILFTLTITLLACSNSKKKLTILFDHIDNLEVGSGVHMKGIPVGKVTHVGFFRDSVLADIQFDKEIDIPIDSRFVINSPIVGSAYISIEFSDNTTYLKNKDTVRGYYDNKKVLDDIVSDSMKREKLQKSLDKIAEGVKELVNLSKDSTQTNK